MQCEGVGATHPASGCVRSLRRSLADYVGYDRRRHRVSQTGKYEEFADAVSAQEWAQNPDARSVVSWLSKEEQKAWIALLLLALRGHVQEEIVALVGAQMYAKEREDEMDA